MDDSHNIKQEHKRPITRTQEIKGKKYLLLLHLLQHLQAARNKPNRTLSIKKEKKSRTKT